MDKDDKVMLSALAIVCGTVLLMFALLMLWASVDATCLPR